MSQKVSVANYDERSAMMTDIIKCLLINNITTWI